MMLRLFLFVSAVFAALQLSAQRNVFLEIGGSGGLGSINYEAKFLSAGYRTPPYKPTGKKDKSGIAWRVNWRAGLGLSPIDKNNGWVLVFPVMLHYAYGRNAHQLELGGGFAPSITTKGSPFIKSPFLLGYKYIPATSRLYYRISYTPICAWLVDFQWQHWAGVSIGYVFEHEQD